MDAPSNKNRMATALLVAHCAIGTGWKPAPMLDFRSLPGTNKEMFQQFINKRLWSFGGYLQSDEIASKLFLISRIQRLHPDLSGSESEAAQGLTRITDAEAAPFILSLGLPE